MLRAPHNRPVNAAIVLGRQPSPVPEVGEAPKKLAGALACELVEEQLHGRCGGVSSLLRVPEGSLYILALITIAIASTCSRRLLLRSTGEESMIAAGVGSRCKQGSARTFRLSRSHVENSGFLAK